MASLVPSSYTGSFSGPVGGRRGGLQVVRVGDRRHDQMPLAAEFGEGVFGLVGVQSLAVPAFFVGEEGDAVAFFGLGDNPSRLVGLRQGFGIGVVNGG